MSENVPANTDLLYRLHDRPTPIKAFGGVSKSMLIKV
jgi:xanthine permease XanP